MTEPPAESDATSADEIEAQVEAFLAGLPPFVLVEPADAGGAADDGGPADGGDWRDALLAMWETLPEFLVGLPLAGAPEVVRHHLDLAFERYDGIRRTVGDTDSLAIGESDGAIILTWYRGRAPDDRPEMGAEVVDVHECADADALLEGLRTAVLMMVDFGDGATPQELGLVAADDEAADERRDGGA